MEMVKTQCHILMWKQGMYLWIWENVNLSSEASDKMSPDTDVFIQKEALAQEHFFHRTPPVAASDRSFEEYRLMRRGLNTATQRL